MRAWGCNGHVTEEQLSLDRVPGARRGPASVASGLAALRGSSGTAGVAARSPASTAFRPDQTCVGQPAGADCWMEIAERPGCYVRNRGLELGATVTWTGQCRGGLAQGTGTLTWVWDRNRKTDTGRLEDGRYNGHWVIRLPNGVVQEGSIVADEMSGHWVARLVNGDVYEGLVVDGDRDGRWILRSTGGDVRS